MRLPLIDVGLMNDHLKAHQGMLYKLKQYRSVVKDPFINTVIDKQIEILKDHVRTMLELLNPNRTSWVSLATTIPSFDTKNIATGVSLDSEQLKKIVTELESTSKHMANENYTSALMMDDRNVKHVHFQMAMQEATLQNYYAHYLKQKGWSFIPKATEEVQYKTIEHYKYMI